MIKIIDNIRIFYISGTIKDAVAGQWWYTGGILQCDTTTFCRCVDTSIDNTEPVRPWLSIINNSRLFHLCKDDLKQYDKTSSVIESLLDTVQMYSHWIWTGEMYHPNMQEKDI